MKLAIKIIIGVIGITSVGVGIRQYQKSNAPKEYETVLVTSGTLVQTVDATGKIESVNDVALKFEVPGTLTAVNVSEGATVKKGQVLMNLRLSELNAAVAGAQANLNQKLAGATPEDIKYYAAAVDAALANLDAARAGVTQADQNLASVVQASFPKIDDALTQADNILGVDNTFANDSFESTLSSLGNAKLILAVTTYSDTKKKWEILRVAGAKADAEKVNLTLNSVGSVLAAVSDVLKATPAIGNLTQATLDAKKTTIEATRSVINTQYSALLTVRQAVDTAQTSLAAKQAGFDQAVASYQGKIVAPREVDVASLRASLLAALANREKAILVSPIDGQVTKVNKKVGEAISSADIAVQVLSPHYEVQVDIPETDVSKLKLHDAAIITLDAFGEDTKFQGLVLSIDPGSTEVQDVVYYKVKIDLAASDKPVKPGMTANVSIKTAEKQNALSVPLRSVRTRADSSKYVRLLVGNEEKEVTVKLGLKADGGKVEILEGVTVNDKIILAVK